MRKVYLFIFLSFSTICLLAQSTVKIKVNVKTNATTWSGNKMSLKNLSGTTTYIAEQVYVNKDTLYTYEVNVPAGTRLKLNLFDALANGIGTGSIEAFVDGHQAGYHTGSMASNYDMIFDAKSKAQCGIGEVQTFIKLTKGGDNIILKICSEDNSQTYFYYDISSNACQQFWTSVITPEDKRLKFIITDPAGYGMASSGTYKLYNSCELIASGGQDFDITKTIPFNSTTYNHIGNVFEKVYGAELHDRAKSVAPVCQGGYIVAGTTGPENIAPQKQFYLLRLNSFGDTIWTKHYGAPGVSEEANKVISTPDGGFFVVGIAGSSAGQILRTNSKGDSIYMKTVAGTTSLNSAIQTQDGNIVVVGYGTFAGNRDFVATKINPANGNTIWQYNYGNTYDNYAYDVVEDSDGNLYLTGSWRQSNATPWNGDEIDAAVVKTDKNGNQLLVKTFGAATRGDVMYSIIVSSNGEIVCAGQTSENGSDIFFAKLDKSNLNILYSQKYGVPADGDYGESARSIVEDAEGNFIAFGFKGNPYTNSVKLILVKINPTGTLQWQKEYGGSYNNIPGQLILAHDGSLILTGDDAGQYSGEIRSNVYVARVDTGGCMVQKPLITGENEFCKEKSVLLTASKMNTIKPASYTWSDSKSGQTNTINAQGSYTVTVSDAYGCSIISDPFMVDTITLPYVKLSSGNSDLCMGKSIMVSANHTIEEDHEYTYQWSNDKEGSSITINEAGTFNVEVTDETTGCKSGSNSIEINMLTPYDDESICLVSIDSVSGKNMVTWHRTNHKNIASYNVYKVFGKTYIPLDNILFDSLSVFIDYGSTPDAYVARYAITVVDSCGNESEKSPYHQSMLLQASKGTSNTEANLIWSKYEDESGSFIPDFYYIYKGKSKSKLELLDSVSGILSPLYIDKKFDGKSAFYQIGIKTPTCSPAVLKAEAGPYSQSLSNIAEYKTDAVSISSESTFYATLYPNPINGSFNITVDYDKTSDLRISFINAVGETIAIKEFKSILPGNNNMMFEANEIGLSAGFYLVKIEMEGNTVLLKAICK